MIITREKSIVVTQKVLPKRCSERSSPAHPEDTKDAGLIPGSGRAPRVGTGNPFQYSCLENSMDSGAWWVAVQGVAKSQT